MKWPWVSRSRYEEMDRFYDGLLVASRLSMNEQQQRYDALLEKFTALRIAGAVEPEPKPEKAAKAEPDPVTQAIIAKAGRSPLLRKHYNDYVREQRAAQVDDAEIAKAILEGQSLDPEVDGVPL